MSGALQDAGARAIPDEKLTEFAFASGALRGTWLTLYPARLLHEGSDRVESIALARLCAVRVAYGRGSRSIGWGAALALGALVAFAISGPLGEMARAAADGIVGQAGSAQTGVAEALIASFRGLAGLAGLLPVVALALAAAGAALVVLGLRGLTTLTLLFGAGEREFSVRGRDPVLFDFAEAVNDAMARLD